MKNMKFYLKKLNGFSISEIKSKTTLTRLKRLILVKRAPNEWNEQEVGQPVFLCLFRLNISSFNRGTYEQL